jgi:hypothetical protein
MYTLDYTQNLLKLKPNYVVHGDDWKTGIQSAVREKVINTIKHWGGELINLLNFPNLIFGVVPISFNDVFNIVEEIPSV